MGTSSFDVVVVGAGTAGANVAHQFARRGRSVLLVDRRSADAAGAQWQNGLLDEHFDLAGLDRPEPPERGRAHSTTHLRAGHPRVGPTLTESPTVAVDMGLLGRRLRRLAEDDGVEMIERVRSLSVEVDEATGRLRELTLHEDGAAPVRVAARLFVDASGRTGALRRHSAALAPWCPPIRADELCSASDFHHRIADPDAALRFLERHGAKPGEAVTYVGLAGGFSTCNVTVDDDLSGVGILVGCLANGRYSTGPRMVADLCEREPWIGEFVRGGSGVIPLRRPWSRFTAPGIALVGDSACQVFPAHGSGVGMGLIAGTMLADGVAAIDDPGDERILWSRYQAQFQHRLGGMLASYDALRRASTAIGSEGVEAMVGSGIMAASTTRIGLEQRLGTPPPDEAARSARALLGQPRLARIMVPALVRSRALAALGPRYPAHLDLDALRKWDRRVERLLGPLPS